MYSLVYLHQLWLSHHVSLCYTGNQLHTWYFLIGRDSQMRDKEDCVGDSWHACAHSLHKSSNIIGEDFDSCTTYTALYDVLVLTYIPVEGAIAQL